MMRRDPAALRRKAERQRDVEILERAHLAVEPGVGVRTQAIGPTQACAQLLHTQLLEPAHTFVEPWILEVKPLADAQCRCEVAEVPQRELWTTVFAQESH